MTFCSNEQNESEIIVSAKKQKNSYLVEYLDGSVSSYYHFDPNHYEFLENKMIEQAKDRDKLEYSVTLVERWFSTLACISVISLSVKTFKGDFLLFGCVCLLLALYLSYKMNISVIKLKELKKYRILLENYKEIKEHPELDKIIEFDSLYRTPIDIFNIDSLSLYDMKVLKKELKRLKK